MNDYQSYKQYKSEKPSSNRSVSKNKNTSKSRTKTKARTKAEVVENKRVASNTRAEAKRAAMVKKQEKAREAQRKIKEKEDRKKEKENKKIEQLKRKEAYRHALKSNKKLILGACFVVFYIFVSMILLYNNSNIAQLQYKINSINKEIEKEKNYLNELEAARESTYKSETIENYAKYKLNMVYPTKDQIVYIKVD